jgi:TPR repeat protein
MRKITFIVFTLFFGFTQAAVANTDKLDTDITQAMKYLKAYKIDKAMNLLQPYAEQGNGRAQYYLASAHHKNLDVKNAAKWYWKAAKSGYPDAQHMVGNYMKSPKFYNNDFYHNQNIPDHINRARAWYQKAAAQGYPPSLFELGSWYYYGKWVPLDYSKSLELHLKAAEKGFIKSQMRAAFLYKSGFGMAHPDGEKALRWFQKVLKNGNSDQKAEAREKISELIDYANNTYKNGVTAYQKKDFKTSFKQILYSAQMGYAEAQYTIGNFFANGIGTKKDLEKTIFWLERAAAKGHAKAAFGLGQAYAQKGRPKESSKIFYQLGQRALRAGDMKSVEICITALTQINQTLHYSTATKMAAELKARVR